MAQVEIVNNIRLNAGLKDKDGDLGTSGQVLSSTGDAVNWIDSAATYELTVAGDGGGPYSVTNSGQLFLVGGVGIETPQTQPVSGSTTITYNLTTANPSPGTYANANITVDAYGRVTLATANSNVNFNISGVNAGGGAGQFQSKQMRQYIEGIALKTAHTVLRQNTGFGGLV